LLKQRAKPAPPQQAAANYPSPLPPDHFPPDPAAPVPAALPAEAPVAVAPAATVPQPAEAPTSAAATPAVERTPHPNSPQMMHAHERTALAQPAPATDQSAPATSHKPGDE